MSFDLIRKQAVRHPGNPAAYTFEAAAWLAELTADAYLRLLDRVEMAGGDPERVSVMRDRARRIRAGRSARRTAMSPPSRAVSLDIGGRSVKFGLEREVSGDFLTRVVPRDEKGFLVHEPGVQRVLAESLGPGALFVDIGAHIGYFSCYAAALGATVMAVEIQATLCDAIAMNAAINDAWRVHTICAAMGAEPGVAQIWRMEPRPGTQTITERDGGGWCPVSSINHDLIPVLTIDQLMGFPAAGAPGSILVKVDVEGAEGKVLAGARSLIERGAAAFIVEFHPPLLVNFGTKARDIVDLFPGDRWRFHLLGDDGDRELDREGLLVVATGADDAGDRSVLISPR